MSKKSTRIRTLEAQIEKSETARKVEAHQREKLMEDLASAGLIRVEGDRTREDRLRAARAGVLVFDDVALLAHPVLTLEQDTLDDSSYGFLRSAPGRIRATLRLEVTGDPELLDLLGEHLRRPF